MSKKLLSKLFSRIVEIKPKEPPKIERAKYIIAINQSADNIRNILDKHPGVVVYTFLTMLPTTFEEWQRELDEYTKTLPVSDYLVLPMPLGNPEDPETMAKKLVEEWAAKNLPFGIGHLKTYAWRSRS